MSKKDLEKELKRQVQEKNISKWISVVFIVIGLLLTVSIVFAVIGIPILIIALITGYRADNKAKMLYLKLLEVQK